MADPETLAELDQRIAIVRGNLRELVEQAAAYSGAADEARTADRIADQEAKLAALLKAGEIAHLLFTMGAASKM
jgi:predicted RNA-binding protein